MLSKFNSGKPPLFDETIAFLEAMASSAASPKLSVFDGKINISEWHKTFSTSFVFPKK